MSYRGAPLRRVVPPLGELARELERLCASYGDAAFAAALTAFAKRRYSDGDAPAGLLEALERSSDHEAMHASMHEIRSLLTAVIANCEVADELARSHAELGPLERAELAECLSDARLAVEHVIVVSQDVRAMAPVSRGCANLAECVGRAARLIQQAILIGRHRAELVVEPKPGVEVAAPPGEILQVLLNLSRNALDAVDGRCEPLVRLRSWASQSMAYVAVEDNGPGIAQEQTARLFKPFYTTKSTGTGMGLHVCKRLVDGWGGQLEVRSEVDGGAAFIVGIPRA